MRVGKCRSFSVRPAGNIQVDAAQTLAPAAVPHARQVMEDAAVARSNIEHYRTLLNLFMTDETRQAVERLIARAQAQLEMAYAPESTRSQETGD
jgi:hypothetical protein